MILPVELMDKIVLYTGDIKVADALEPYISSYVYDQLEKHVLVYGQIQGGKTNAITSILKRKKYNNVKKVLVVQNSLLVLKQYIFRLKKENISFQVVDRHVTNLTKDVLVVLNNKFRYEYAKKVLGDAKFILLLDEADQTFGNCSLIGYKTYHITATPFYTKKFEVHFDRILKVKTQTNYYGIENLFVKADLHTTQTVNDFLKTTTGMMLINRYSYVDEMINCAKHLAQNHPKTPIVLLTSEKWLFLNGKREKLGKTSISKVIDTFNDYPHIVFIANRLSNRGLSYVSSDYTRHLTHQCVKVKQHPAGFLQSLRILGIYTDLPKLTLYIDNESRFDKHLKFLKQFDVESLKTV